MSEYSAKLKDPKWQRKRLEIMQRDEFRCRLCDDAGSTLHVHHLRYERGADPWDYNDTSLLTVCESCHEELHVTKVGESLLESLIVGGAMIGDLYNILYAVQLEFSDGPFAARLSAAQWEALPSALTHVVSALRRGVSADHIGEALRGLSA